MKFGFPVDSNNLDALIKERMSSAAWLLVVDTDDMSFEAVRLHKCPPDQVPVSRPLPFCLKGEPRC